MEVLKKFEKGALTHTYQRIDCEYKADIFLGYNDEGQMSMVITGNGKSVPVVSSKIICVRLNRREDGKLALSFDLLDNTYKSMFIVFCKDVILYCEKVGNEEAIHNGILRWKYWREMFGKKKTSILESAEIKGLLGELIELRDFFIKKWGVKKAVASWMGPLLGHKDFELDGTWYEIKCINENAVQVTVSSLEQLESDINGHLVIVKLENTSSLSNNSVNLNKIVMSVVDKISDPDDLDIFRTKLDNIGFVFDAEYDNYNFFHKGTQRYCVNERFPKISRSQLNSTISNVKYTILLEGISEFKEE